MALRERLAKIGIEFKPSTPVFDIQTAQPEVARELLRTPSVIEPVFAAFTHHMPAPRRFEVNGDPGCYRLPNHNRSFCCSMGAGANPFEAPTLVVKGAEPLTADYDHLLRWMKTAPFRRSVRVMADHFPLAEGKIPGAMSAAEALREAHIAAAFQRRHLEVYGELARFPTPLFVHVLSPADTERCTGLLRTHLSPTAFQKIEPIVASGIGIYMYLYPTAPVRVNDVASNPTLHDYIRRCTPRAAIAGWMTLLARMLLLRFLPYTPRSEGLGACMDFGNATLDGGFCDADSVEPFEECDDDELFVESIVTSLGCIRMTASRVLGPGIGLDHDSLYPETEAFVIGRYIYHQFVQALNAEARPGLSADPRILRTLSPTSLADVEALLQRARRPRVFAQYRATGHRSLLY